MEELEGFIRFQEPRGDLKGVFQALPVLVVAGAPVADLVEFAGLKEADDAFDLFIAFGITGILELVLITLPYVIYHLIQTLDDVEGIDADLCPREYTFCHGDKAVAHVTAEVFHMLPLILRELAEVLGKVDARGLVQDVDDGMGIPIGDVAVIFIPVPPVMLLAPDAAVAVEFIDTESFGEPGRTAEVDGCKDRLDSIGGNTVAACNFREGDRLQQIQKDGVIEGLCHMERGMKPVRLLIERSKALLTEQPAFVEDEERAPVVVRDMPYSLPGAGVLDDAVMRSAVRTEALLRCRDMESDQVILPEGFDVFDSCFLRKFG